VNPRRLYRCRENRQIAGVAAGMAEYLEVDPTVIRIAWILSAFIGGFTILLYIILAFVIPLEPIALAAPVSQPGTDGAGLAPGAELPAGASTETLPGATGMHWASPAAAAAHTHDRGQANGRPGQAGLVFGVLLVVFGTIALIGPMLPGWAGSAYLGPAFVLALGVALLAGAARRPVAGS